MGVAFDVHEFGEFDRAGLGDNADIISAKVYKHRVLGDFFGIGEEVLFHRLVFVGGAPPATGASQWAVGDDESVLACN